MSKTLWVPDVARVAQPPVKPLGQWCLVWVAHVGHWSPEQVVMQSHAGNLLQKSWFLFLKSCSGNLTRVSYKSDKKSYYSLLSSLMLCCAILGQVRMIIKAVVFGKGKEGKGFLGNREGYITTPSLFWGVCSAKQMQVLSLLEPLQGPLELTARACYVVLLGSESRVSRVTP